MTADKHKANDYYPSELNKIMHSKMRYNKEVVKAQQSKNPFDELDSEMKKTKCQIKKKLQY